MNFPKTNNLMLIFFASSYCYAVSDWVESNFEESAMSIGADDSTMEQENGKQEMPTINSNNFNDIERRGSELLSKFDQICDAIKYNSKDNKGWLKKEIADFRKYLNIQNKDGNTILHLAIHMQDVKILHYLIKNGADHKIKNAIGMSPNDYVELLRNKKSEKNSTKKELKLLTYWDKYVLKNSKEETTQMKQVDRFKELKNKFKKTIKKLKNNFSYDQ